MSVDDRLARLETKVEIELSDIREIKVDLKAIRAELNRYKGAFGIIVFLFSVVVASYKLILEWISK